MQAVSVISSSSSFNSHNSNHESQDFQQLSANFSSKLQISASENDLKPENEGDEDEQIESESEDEEADFTFVCTNPDGSPISADDIFQDGQIRPVFPLFNRDLLFADDAEDGGADHSTAVRAASSFSSSSSSPSSSLRSPLKKLFFEENKPSSSSSSEADELEGVPEGTYCEWSKKPADAAPELKNKSNSTGSSRLWRVRDLKFRSNSDGKDAFVFLNPNSTAAAADKKSGDKVVKTVEKVKGKAKKAETASSAHEKHYVKNRAKKEGDKRRSYLPYRQDLVGFFTNVNGFSRNVHPF